MKYGDGLFLDALDQDALVCGFDGVPMGAAIERYQAGLGITRADQDAFAAVSLASMRELGLSPATARPLLLTRLSEARTWAGHP